MFDQLRDGGNAHIPYSFSIGAIKALNVREKPVEWITVQKKVYVQKLMKEKNVVPYVLPKNRGLHQPINEDERLTSEDEEQTETDEYHDGPQLSSDESEYKSFNTENFPYLFTSLYSNVKIYLKLLY